MSTKTANVERVMPGHPSTCADNYEFVRYEPRHRAGVMKLFARLWPPGDETNAAYFDWKYCRNPYVRDPLIYLALHQGEAVCVFGWFPGCYEAGEGKRYLCLAGSDAVTEPEHRRRGLHDRIKNTALSEAGDRTL